jgi:hypothetical protein
VLFFGLAFLSLGLMDIGTRNRREKNMDAMIVTLKPDGDRRRISIHDFYRLPGPTPHIETMLEQGELITHIELPQPPAGKQAYRKVGDRASYAFALVSVAGIVHVADGKVESASLAFGGLAPMPWRDSAKTARSQCLGGMTFGIGSALTEKLIHDPRSGKLVNRDLAEYHVPVNADVPQLEVHFLSERDIHANPIHVKGIGELGISGAGAAIANAIHNACGIRVRDFPVTLDKLLSKLPPV